MQFDRRSKRINPKANRPYARRSDLLRFLATGSLAIPRAYRAGWLVLREAVTPALAAAILLVAAGIYVVNRPEGHTEA